MPASFSTVFATPPPNFSGTWADFVAFLNDNNQGAPDVDWSSFVIGATEPTSNVGPWLKNGREWHWFDALYGRYVPIDVRTNPPYTVSETAPAAPVADANGLLPTPSKLWLQLDSLGHIIDWYYWSGTAWVPTHLPVSGTTEPAEAYRKRIWTRTDANGYPIGQYRWNPTTSAWVNLDTFWVEPAAPPDPEDPEPDPDPEVPPPVVEDERKKPWLKMDANGYPVGMYVYDPALLRWRPTNRTFAFSYRRNNSYEVASGSGESVLPWEAKNFDLYDVVSEGVFTAPVTGIYHFDLAVQWDYQQGTFTGKTLQTLLRRNGAPIGVTQNEDPDNAGQYLMNMSRTAYLNIGDQVDVTVEVGPTATGSCIWSIGTAATSLAGYLVEEVIQ